MGRRSTAGQRRSEIVWALYDCLAEQGHEKVTIKVIASRAGLPHGVIHYYFDSKDDIISELGQALVDRYTRRLDDRLAGAHTDREEIAMTVDFMVEELIFDHRLNRVFFNLIQMAFEREPLHQVLTAMFRVYRQRLVDVLGAAGIGTRSASIGAAVVALAEGFALQWMVEPGALTKKDAKTALVQMIGDIS